MASIIGKLKDNFKNFEKKFENEILNKKELTNSKNVESDFIRIYELKDNKSIAFSTSNTKKEKVNYEEQYMYLFNKVLMESNEYFSLEEYINKDKNKLIEEAKLLLKKIEKNDKNFYSMFFPRNMSFSNFSVNQTIENYLLKEIITLTYYNGDKYSKTFEYNELKESFKNFIKNEEIENFKDFFNLIKDRKENIKINSFEMFLNDNKDFLNKYVDNKNKEQTIKKEFKDINDVINKELSKLRKELEIKHGYTNKQNELFNIEKEVKKTKEELYGYYGKGEKSIIKDYYINNNFFKDIGFNNFKTNLENNIEKLKIDDMKIEVEDKNLDF